MFFSQFKQVARQGVAFALACLMPAAVVAQTADTAPPLAPSASQPHTFELKDYSKSRGHFPNLIAPYTPQHVSPPDLSNTPRIRRLCGTVSSTCRSMTRLRWLWKTILISRSNATPSTSPADT